MADPGFVQVLLKSNPGEQTFLKASLASGKLNQSSIKVRPELLSLTSNNLTYANYGTVLNWWSTYPVPDSLPVPYNDQSKYGICSAWGYARVQATTINEIAENDLIFGYWPLSSSAVDLQLEEKNGILGHYTETSPWRQKLLPLYNYYQIIPPDSRDTAEDIQLTRRRNTAIYLLWQCGYTLNRFVFSKTHHVHPMPELGLPWSPEEADLSEALIIVLASAGKTARSFAHQLATNRLHAEEGPIALLEVGSGSALMDVPSQDDLLHLNHRFVGYNDMLAASTVSWIQSFGNRLRRAVLVDFGGRNGAAEKMYAKLKDDLMLAKIAVIGVGPAPKVFTPADVEESTKTAEKLGVIPSMASGQWIAAMERVGAPERFFAESEREFERVVRGTGDGEGRSVLGVKVVVGRGMMGEDGLEGGWRRICDGLVGGGEGLVYEL